MEREKIGNEFKYAKIVWTICIVWIKTIREIDDDDTLCDRQYNCFECLYTFGLNKRNAYEAEIKWINFYKIFKYSNHEYYIRSAYIRLPPVYAQNIELIARKIISLARTLNKCEPLVFTTYQLDYTK